jgi:hypothetical protein
MPWAGNGGRPGDWERRGDETRAGRPGKGKNLPLWQPRHRGMGSAGHGVGGDASEWIPDSEVQDHITDVGSGFKVPLGAIRFPRSPDGNGNVDA